MHQNNVFDRLIGCHLRCAFQRERKFGESNIPALTRDFQQVKAEIPRALEAAEIPVIVGNFRHAALNAIEAGFDGVELQGANSHLIEQFLEDGTNTRSDNYGGSLENRCRFLLEIVAEVSAAIGADRPGVRLSPFGQYGGIHDSKPDELFSFVITSSMMLILAPGFTTGVLPGPGKRLASLSEFISIEGTCYSVLQCQSPVRLPLMAP